ncbi:MAG: Fic family protein [Candidatus Methylomirabilales bacterium]
MELPIVILNKFNGLHLDAKDLQESTAGRCVKTPQGYWAFVPNPLPPEIPYNPELTALLSEADRTLGQLAGVGRLLPNPHLLVAPYVRREAVLSSRIEGTQASLGDLFFFEAAPAEPPRVPDVREVYNYVRALEYGLARLKDLPLSSRLVREIHARLMEGVRGAHLTPGEFRQSQNWIGPPGCTLHEATFVPPPLHEMKDAMGLWEKYLYSESPEPPLVQCALMHYQFEAIHPFLDGNGRVGRLLITFFLCERGHLPQPLLYLSAFFEGYRDEYYRRLLAVSQQGDWPGWIAFFLRGVSEQATDAVQTAERILDLQSAYRERIQGRRSPGPTLDILGGLFVNPYVTITGARKKYGVNFHTAQAAIDLLCEAGILREVTGRQRNRIYCAEELLRTIEGKPAGARRT